MKHKLNITLILLGMFLLTQFIGLLVVHAFTPQMIVNPATGATSEAPGNELPFGLQTSTKESSPNFITIIISFAMAFAIILILIKYKWKLVIRLWFLLVIILALGISIYAFLKYTPLINNLYTFLTIQISLFSIIALTIAIPLAILKIFRPHMLTHNLTELFIYPGIAVVFVPLFMRPEAVSFLGKAWPAIAILIIISFYDMWAVWRSGIMQKMAKFQMEELKVFGGFLIPTVPDKIKNQIKRIKEKYKGKKIPDRLRKKKFKVNVAILGGGDIIFPIIIAGVFMRAFNFKSALLILFGAFAGLVFLFMITKKGKSYPAMPYISVGIFLGMILAKLLNYI